MQFIGLPLHDDATVDHGGPCCNIEPIFLQFTMVMKKCCKERPLVYFCGNSSVICGIKQHFDELIPRSRDIRMVDLLLPGSRNSMSCRVVAGRMCMWNRPWNIQLSGSYIPSDLMTIIQNVQLTPTTVVLQCKN